MLYFFTVSVDGLSLLEHTHFTLADEFYGSPSLLVGKIGDDKFAIRYDTDRV